MFFCRFTCSAARWHWLCFCLKWMITSEKRLLRFNSTIVYYTHTHTHTHCKYTRRRDKQTNVWTSAQKGLHLFCSDAAHVCLSLLMRPFHLVCIDCRLTSHSDTLGGPIHVCSPRDTHWVHCGEECLLSWPEPACESMSIIPRQWVLHNAAATAPPNGPRWKRRAPFCTRPRNKKWRGCLNERTVEWTE